MRISLASRVIVCCIVAFAALGVGLGAGSGVALGAARDGENLVVNPGFDPPAASTAGQSAPPGDPLHDWETFGPHWRAGQGDDAFSPPYGVVCDVMPGDDAEYCGIHQEVRIDPKKTYDAVAMVRLVNISATQTYLEVQFMDASGAVLSQTQSPALAHDQPFTKCQLLNLKPPAGAVTASVRGVVQVMSAPAQTNFQIFDDFSFRVSPSAN